MRTYDETVAALGAPASVAVLDDWNENKLIVARWLRRDAEVARSEADALRVAVSLGCSSELHYTQSGNATSISFNTGDTAIVPPGPESDTFVEGTIDIMEVFVDTSSLGAFGRGRSLTKPVFEFADDDLRASAIGLFLAAGGTLDKRARSAAATFGRSVFDLLGSSSMGGSGCAGGLAPRTLRRIDGLIDAWLDDPGAPKRGVIEFAEMAQLQLNHFMRAFRKSTGTSPYQYMMARRRRLAMVLLGRPGMSIAEVSDRLGFSSPAHFSASFRQRFGASPGDCSSAVLDPALHEPKRLQ